MKLNTLSEYGPPEPVQSLNIDEKSMMGSVFKFIKLIDNFFKTGKIDWVGSKVSMKYGENTFSILVRCGVHEGSYLPSADKQEKVDSPRLVIEPSWDNSVEMRLDIPRKYGKQVGDEERAMGLKLIAAQASAQLPDALATISGRLIAQMKKSGSGKVKDFP